VAMTVVASRELFLFVVARDPLGLNTARGSSHLWLAAAAGITACAAFALMSYVFSRQGKNKWSKVEMTPTGPPLTIVSLSLLNSPASAPFDPIRLALANLWLPQGQADDRMQMNGSVTESGETPPGQRAFARRTHQLMFKKWSQARHD
jgi:hypothetical protein